MNTPWARNRKAAITILIGVIAFGAIVLLALPYLKQEATCFDGRQNGTELGTDCGGSCQRYCSFQIAPVLTQWSTVTELVPGIYDAAAYLENPNQNAATYEPVPYMFTVVNSQNEVIATRSGAIRLGPQEVQVAIEHQIALDEVPAATFFTFDEQGVWYAVDGRQITLLPLSVVEKRLERTATNPKVTARLLNDSLYTLRNLDVVALLYNEAGNLLATSKTTITTLPAQQSMQAVFTWPRPLAESVATVEIVPHINPFTIDY